MKLFNFKIGKKKGREQQNQQEEKGAHCNATLADHFKGFDDFIRQLDGMEKTPRERLRENFQRPIEEAKFDIISFDAGGDKKSSTQFAFDSDEEGDESPSEKALPTSTHGDVINETVWAHYGNDSYIGWNACAVLAQNPIIHLACHIPAVDAIAPSYNLTFADSKQADVDKDGVPDDEFLTRVKKETEALGLNDTCVKLEYNKRVFGSGVAMPIITNEDGTPFDMSKPFNADGLKGKRYGGFKVVDPYWLAPKFEQGATQNPTHARFMQPTWYQLPNARLVHYTWFVKVDNAEVSDILKPTYYYGGMPLTQMIYKRVWCAERTANEAPLLAMSKRMLVVDANVQQVIKNKSYIYKLMQVITKCRNNWGVFFKSPTSNIQQIDTSLSEFEECMFSQFQLVASIAQMPATKLLQTTPKGFNSTGEFEWKIYAQLLETIQNTTYKPFIEKHIKILTAVAGDMRTITVTFNPVDAPSERDRAEVEAVKASTRVNYVQNGILTAQEVRAVLRRDEDGEFSSISKENQNIEDTDEVEKVLKEIEEDEGEEDETNALPKPSQDYDETFAEDYLGNIFDPSEHPRDKDGKFVKKGTGETSIKPDESSKLDDRKFDKIAHVGLSQGLRFYLKRHGRHLQRKDAKGRMVTEVVSEKEQKELEAKEKPFRLPPKGQREIYETRQLSKTNAEIYNGGERKPNLDDIERFSKTVKKNAETKFDKIPKKDIYKRGKQVNKAKIAGKPQYEWTLGTKKLTEGEAFDLERALVMSANEIVLNPQYKGVAVRKDFAFASGQILEYTQSGIRQRINDIETVWNNKRKHIASTNALFQSRDVILDEVINDFGLRNDDMGVAAYLQYRATFRVGSSSSAKNLGMLQLTKEHVKLENGKIIFDFNAKNGRWHTELVDGPLYRYFEMRLKQVGDNENEPLVRVKYKEYNKYLSEVSERVNKRNKDAGLGPRVELASHDMRRLSASVYASQLVDKITVDPKKDPDGYVKEIEKVVQKTTAHINDKDAMMGFRSYIAPIALWKNAQFIYESNERFQPPAM